MTWLHGDRQRIMLVRHGQTAGNLDGASAPLSGWHDVELTDRGRTEASLLGRWFSRLRPYPLVFSSSSRRAVATAATMVAPVHGGFTSRDDLREIHCGALEGVPVGELEARYPDLWRANLAQNDDRFRWPDGESYAEFRARALSSVARIVSEHGGATLLLVTHAGFISQVLGALHGAQPAQWDRWRPRNGSITTIEWGDQEKRVLSYDDVDHLESLVVGGTERADLRTTGSALE